MLYVYLITNEINKKIYIGYTTKGEKRWNQHLRVAKGGPIKYSSEYSYIHRAINKYGIDNFVFEPLEYHVSIKELKESEIFWISYFKSIGAQLYNLTTGGDGSTGYKADERQKKEISTRMLGQFSGNKNPFYGKTHSEEAKNIIANTRLYHKNNIKYWGEYASQSIFKEDEVKDILHQYYVLNLSANEISRKINKKVSTIKSIISGRSWQRTLINIAKNPRTKSEGINLYFDKRYGKIEIIEKPCQTCNTIISIKIRQNVKKGRNRKFCSNDCRLRIK